MSGVFPNAFHVARREYLFRVRGRAFLITTVLLAVLVAGFTMLPTFLGAFGVGEPAEIAVDDQAGDLSTDPVVALQAALSAASEASGEEGPQVTATDDADAAADEVRAGELDGLLTITRGSDDELAFDYLSDEGPTSQTRILVTQAATAMTIQDRLERAGVSSEEAAEIFAPADFTATAADPDAADDEEDFGGAVLLSYIVVILTFMAILTYGNWVAQSVAEEKSGRVMELLITAATPRQLLTGKVLGTGAAGLTQYVVMVGAVVLGLALSGPVSSLLGVSGEQPFELPTIEATFLAAFTVFFLLGFLLYCTLYAAAGSMVSRIEDVQQAVGPLIYLAMAGYFVSFFAPNDPDGQLVSIASIIPFFSPYLMPTRMLLGSPAPWEVVLAIVLLAVTLVLAVWVAARIYSAGVLLYGQRVGIRNVLRATRVAR
jgi:ABC-2 type transport system permease protein